MPSTEEKKSSADTYWNYITVIKNISSFTTSSQREHFLKNLITFKNYFIFVLCNNFFPYFDRYNFAIRIHSGKNLGKEWHHC